MQSKYFYCWLARQSSFLIQENEALQITHHTKVPHLGLFWINKNIYGKLKKKIERHVSHPCHVLHPSLDIPWLHSSWTVAEAECCRPHSTWISQAVTLQNHLLFFLQKNSEKGQYQYLDQPKSVQQFTAHSHFSDLAEIFCDLALHNKICCHIKVFRAVLRFPSSDTLWHVLHY